MWYSHNKRQDVAMDFVLFLLLTYQVHLGLGHIPVSQPTFTNEQTNWEVVENSTAWLPCNVENLGDNVVRWWRGETLLADSIDHTHPRPPRMRMWTNNTLEISKVQPDDAVQYICQVVRKEPWSPLQLTHHLRVLYPPQVFPEPEKGLVDVKLGETVEIACLTKGVPSPNVTWRIQEKDIVNNQERPHVLILHATSPKVAQTYRCIADNGIGRAYADIRVNILYKPIVVADVSWMHAAPGLHAELVCRVSAEPPPRVQWFTGKEAVAFNASPRVVSYVQGQQHVLQFRNITSEDFGIYTCRASNSEGLSEATVELSGRAQPALFKRDAARYNNSALLIWEVDSYSPIIDYSLKFRQVPAPDDADWRLVIIPADGQNPGPIHSKSYMLSGLQTASTYEAVVSSRNRYGLSTPSAPFLFSTEGADYMINGSNEDQASNETESSEEDVLVHMKSVHRDLSISHGRSAVLSSSSYLVLVLASAIFADGRNFR